MARHRFALAAALAALAPAAGLAQHAGEEPEEKPGLRISAGAGVAYTPKYPGAEDYRLRVLPLFGVTYGRFYVGGDGDGGGGAPGLGVNLLRDSAWRLGVGIAPGFGDARRESDHPTLQGLGDIERATRALLTAGYNTRWLSVTLRVAPDIEGKDQGTLAFFDVVARHRATPRLTLSAGPGISWADDDYMRTFFGVTPEQSARGVLPPYEAKSGVHALRFGFNAGYRIDRNWSLGGRLGVSRLVRDAEQSPITRDREQRLAALFASYRF